MYSMIHKSSEMLSEKGFLRSNILGKHCVSLADSKCALEGLSAKKHFLNLFDHIHSMHSPSFFSSFSPFFFFF